MGRELPKACAAFLGLGVSMGELDSQSHLIASWRGSGQVSAGVLERSKCVASQVRKKTTSEKQKNSGFGGQSSFVS